MPAKVAKHAKPRRTDIIQPPPLPPRKSATEIFLEEVGRDEMLLALQESTHTPIIAIAQALCDPLVSIGEAKRKSGATFADLVKCFQEHQQAKGIIRMMRHMPQVMEDIAVDAKSKIEPCPKCDGVGEIDGKEGESRVCSLCRGQGEVRVKGDDAARNLLFEAQGLKGKKGPSVAIQQNFTGGPGLEETLSFTQKMLVE